MNLEYILPSASLEHMVRMGYNLNWIDLNYWNFGLYLIEI